MQIEDDSFPVFVVYVTDTGPNRAAMFSLYRRTLSLSPAEAKRLLGLPRVELLRGPRMSIEDAIHRVKAMGATVEIWSDPDSLP